MTKATSADDLNELLAQARQLHETGQTRDALHLLESAGPALESPRVLALAAHYYYLLQQYEAAGIAAKRALELNPTNRLALLTSGELNFKSQKYDDAELYFKEAIATGSRSPHPFLRLASIYSVQHQYAKAIDILNHGLEQHTGDQDLLERLQFALTMNGQIQEADRIRKTRLRSDPSDSPDLRALINRFEGLDRARAITQLTLLASMEHYRNEPLIHDQLARFLIEVERYSEAIPYLETVIRFQTRNDSARLNLAQCLVKTGDVQGAWSILNPIGHYRNDLYFQTVIIETLIADHRLGEALDLCIRQLQQHPRDKRLRRLLQQLKRQGAKPSRPVDPAGPA